jgi:hypothetical protein
MHRKLFVDNTGGSQQQKSRPFRSNSLAYQDVKTFESTTIENTTTNSGRGKSSINLSSTRRPSLDLLREVDDCHLSTKYLHRLADEPGGDLEPLNENDEIDDSIPHVQRINGQSLLLLLSRFISILYNPSHYNRERRTKSHTQLYSTISLYTPHIWLYLTFGLE